MKITPNKLRILFVCGRNRWRSPTAERIYRDDPRVEVRSAGVSVKSGHQISSDDLSWADLVLVMEQRHKSRILGMFQEHPPIVSLDIPDDFGYMDEELIGLIREGVEFHLCQMLNIEQAAGPNGGPPAES
jgi:predicted protein tyrosine phosphatase